MMELTATNDLTIGKITKAMLFHSGEPFATSTQIAKYFGVDHKNLLQKIRSFHSYDELISRLKIQPRNRTIRGKEYPFYEVDADAFSFICLSITGKKAEAFKLVFIEAFKKATAEAITVRVTAQANLANENFFALRQETKKGHRSYTDAVKILCEYAEQEKGSSYGRRCPYFKLMQGLVYKALSIKVSKSHKPARDSFSPEMLEAIEETEKYLAGLIMGYVELGAPYRDIYHFCKKDMKIRENE